MQKEFFELNFQACKTVYNVFLKYRSLLYDAYKKYSKECIMKKETVDKAYFNSKAEKLTLPMIKMVYPWLKEADSLALCATYQNLNHAYQNYFKHRCSYPKFKRRKAKNTYITSLVNNNIRFDGKKIRLPKIGYVKLKMHRNLPNNSKIKRCIIKGDKLGRYYICILVCFNMKSEAKNYKSIVGLDFKIGDIFVSSDNFIPKYSRPYRSLLEKLKNMQRLLGKRRKFSKNWFSYLRKIQQVHKYISFKRKDFLHKLSINICKNYDTISIESLSIQEISQKLSNGINTYDTSYYSFCSMLQYKSNYDKKRLIKIDKWFPSSKMCNKCGNIKHDLALEDRVYNCSICGLSIDRDLNAAINIKNEGNRILTEMRN